MSRNPSLNVIPVPGPGAEDVVVATGGRDEGAVFTGTADGAVFRVSHDGTRVDRVAHTGGRPLGIEIAPDGRLLVCDSRKGLLWVDPRSGGVEVITDSVAGTPMKFCNNAAIGDDGTVWFSDSSTLYGVDEWKKDFVRNTRTGRLLRLDPDGTLTTTLTGLAFANGVALAADESFVCVAQTGGRCVDRLWLTGPEAGTRDQLCSDLPGYPDNIARGSDGLIWVTIASPKVPVVEGLLHAPSPVRRIASRIPESLQPKPQRTVRVQAYDAAGRLVHDVDLPSDGPGSGPGYHMVTGVREFEGRVWMGSLEEPAVAAYDL